MAGFSSIAFVLQEFESWALLAGVVPVVDGTSLVELAAQYEARAGFVPSGGYAPLTSSPGTLLAYYLGETSDDMLFGEGKTALLGCSCGEAGCWPFCCRIQVSRNSVTWSGFGQPFRPERDYEGFGPFVFDRGEYEAALAALTRAARA
ncbi:hypothetical protein [Segniliparus rugosus]|uniref:Uncharacterized protein n=1 Tax=Segniliparus rugosus (strain ATCC BAA-974 / DSM 45345 / CCUG 50838 / CIP 108380 / JCM 13579 / CDC 945) TaxID=679197 RepID=E5XN18_SEGRC|nr:hypothetical protein [Segniliparus rugosus]EFV14276.1 hypothetical protein HMPREF9336_00888 [Segniliparus rugosus ATCC BAA-974]